MTKKVICSIVLIVILGLNCIIDAVADNSMNIIVEKNSTDEYETVKIDVSDKFQNADILDIKLPNGYVTSAVVAEGFIEFNITEDGSCSISESGKTVKSEITDYYDSTDTYRFGYTGYDTRNEVYPNTFISDMDNGQMTWKLWNKIGGWDAFGKEKTGDDCLYWKLENRNETTGRLKFGLLIDGNKTSNYLDSNKGPIQTGIILNPEDSVLQELLATHSLYFEKNDKIAEEINILDEIKQKADTQILAFARQRENQGTMTYTIDVKDYYQSGAEVYIKYINGCGNAWQCHGDDTVEPENSYAGMKLYSVVNADGYVGFDMPCGGFWEMGLNKATTITTTEATTQMTTEATTIATTETTTIATTIATTQTTTKESTSSGGSSSGTTSNSGIKYADEELYEYIDSYTLPFDGDGSEGNPFKYDIKCEDSKVTWKKLNLLAGYDMMGENRESSSTTCDEYYAYKDNNINGKLKYSWFFDGSNITPLQEKWKGPMALNINLEKVNSIVNVNFDLQRDLPGNATVTLYVGDWFADGDSLVLKYKDGCGNNSQVHGSGRYSSNHTHNTVVSGLNVSGGYIQFDIAHGGNFTLVTTAQSDSLADDTSSENKVTTKTGTVTENSIEIVTNASEANIAKDKNSVNDNTISGASVFVDVNPEYWAYSYITELSQKGIVAGYKDNTFRPNENISRAEFITMIVKAINADIVDGNTTFIDANNSWAKNYIYTATILGYINGYGNGYFGVNDGVTREQAALIIANIIGNETASGDVTEYKDYTFIALWAESGLRICCEKGILKGYEDNTIRPKNKLTRAEAVTMVCKLMEVIDSEHKK